MIRILNAEDVRKALPMAAAIEGMKSAYAALTSGQAVVPQRSRLSIGGRSADALFMPAYIPGAESGSLAVKIVTLFPTNLEAGLPLIHAAVLAIDDRTGKMLALLEGGTLTAIRTGAGAGAATDLLARPDSRRAAIIGSGVQARTQLEAVCAVRPIDEVRVYSPNPDNVSAFIQKMQHVVDAEFMASGSAGDAIREADIICTATTSTTPVFQDTDVPVGAHINGVGSYTPGMVEIPPATLGRARITVDSRSACAVEAGELIAATRQGLVKESEIVEIGEVILGSVPGRQTAEEITFFKSVGVAVQDAVAAGIALEHADKLGLGQPVDW